MSIKVFKNLFQTIYTLIGVAIVDVCLLVGFIISLSFEQPNYGWISLVAAASLPCLFFLAGFYWIFQRVIIDENGIKVVLFNKVLSKYNYDEIEDYSIGSFMRSSVFKIHTKDGKLLRLDKRNKIIECLKSYNVKQNKSSNIYEQ